MNSISSVACHRFNIRRTLTYEYVTHPKHSAHPETFDLLETVQGLCSSILDDRVQNTVEQSFCDATDLGVDLHERYRRSEHVGPDFCWRIRILSYISIIRTSYLPLG